MGWLKRILCCVCAVLGTAAGTALAGEQSSAGFRVPAASVNAGGAVGMRSASGADMFSQADATIGQASPPGANRNAAGQVVTAGGFWTPGGTSVPPPVCPGDCSGDGSVTVDELVKGVNIALGSADLSTCPVLDANGDGAVTIDELVKAVNNALNGCPVP